MFKLNIFYLLFTVLFLQVLVISVDARKCYVRYPNNKVIKTDKENKVNITYPVVDKVFDSTKLDKENISNSNIEKEIDINNTDNLDKESNLDSDSEYDSETEAIDIPTISNNETMTTIIPSNTNIPYSTSTVSTVYTINETLSVPTSTSTIVNTTNNDIYATTINDDDVATNVSSSIDEDEVTTTIIYRTSTTTVSIATTATKTTTTTTTIATLTPIQNCIKDSGISCNKYNTLCSLGINKTEAEIYGSELLKITNSPNIIDLVNLQKEKYNKDIIYTCSFYNFTQGIHDYRYRSNEKDDDFIKSFEKTNTNVELYGNIKCMPKSQEIIKELDTNSFVSYVKLESNKPIEIECTLSGEGIKGYSYSPLFAIEVSTFRNNGDDIQIKDGQYTLRNNMYNYNKFSDVALSTCSETWSLNVTINDDFGMIC